MPDLRVKRDKKALILMFENSLNCGFWTTSTWIKMSYFDELFIHFTKYTLEVFFWRFCI